MGATDNNLMKVPLEDVKVENLVVEAVLSDAVPLVKQISLPDV
jgi:hypothetical protein